MFQAKKMARAKAGSAGAFLTKQPVQGVPSPGAGERGQPPRPQAEANWEERGPYPTAPGGSVGEACL